MQEYGRYFGMPTCCLRGGCLTGPNHSGVELHGFLSYLVRCNVEGREYKVFGYKGKQVRDNIHSEDVASFIQAFCNAPRCGEVYNIGGGKANSCSILEAFALVEELTGQPQKYTYVDQNRIGDHICYYSDLRKMKSHYPGWTITRPLVDVIQEIVQSWHARLAQRERSLGCRTRMKILITGICGFVGSRLAAALKERLDSVEIAGIDNLLRQGSESNRATLARMGVKFTHGDVRSRSDVDSPESCDWIIDAAANPSVLAGVDGRSSARQLAEHNLSGTLNVLEYCRERRAGLILLVAAASIPFVILLLFPVRPEHADSSSTPLPSCPPGFRLRGITESFPDPAAGLSYGATKLASEIMAIEYGLTFDFPVWVNRCGVLAGAGQFGTAEQGIFSYWLHAYARTCSFAIYRFRRAGLQVRDAFHPADLADLILQQFERDASPDPIFNVGGGASNSMSLAELTGWCAERFGPHEPLTDNRPRPFDIPWLIMDSARTEAEFGWRPKRSLASILDEIEAHVRTIHTGSETAELYEAVGKTRGQTASAPTQHCHSRARRRRLYCIHRRAPLR